MRRAESVNMRKGESVNMRKAECEMFSILKNGVIASQSAVTKVVGGRRGAPRSLVIDH